MIDYKLASGSHDSREQGMCAMEWVAYLAGEEHSDSPVCVDPPLRVFGISLNDTWDDEQRQKLRPYLARCIGTAGDGRTERCLAITGLGSICEQSPEQNRRRKQTIYRWNLRSNVCREVVREVYPYFTAKHHEARLLCGCPSSGPKARAAWEALKSIHQGGEHPDIDFPAPESMFERGWFLRSDVIWAKLFRTRCPSPSPIARPGRTSTCSCSRYIGIELNPAYAEMARERIRRWEANPAGALDGDPEPIEGQTSLLEEAT